MDIERWRLLEFKTSRPRNLCWREKRARYNIALISQLTTLADSVAFFDRRGITEPSLYLNFTDYRNAYNLSLAANIVYDDGAIIISTH